MKWVHRCFYREQHIKLSAVSLFLWLLGTSIRGAKDINTGNVFGWPSEFKLIENYYAVFTQTEAIKYLINSFLITLPTVAISVSLACLAGYALAIYRIGWRCHCFSSLWQAILCHFKSLWFRCGIYLSKPDFTIRSLDSFCFTRRFKPGFALCSCAIL